MSKTNQNTKNNPAPTTATPATTPATPASPAAPAIAADPVAEAPVTPAVEATAVPAVTAPPATPATTSSAPATAKLYRCVSPTTNLEVGKDYTHDQLQSLPGMGGIERLLKLEAVVPADRADGFVPSPIKPEALPAPIPLAATRLA